MFGVVPKKMWKKLNPPDENNMCTWAMRCLLVETGNRKVLIDTGFGNKQDAKFRSYFEPHGKDSLGLSLGNIGLDPEDITDVFLTHMHFDHVGGAVSIDEKGKLVPTFPEAAYWTNSAHYDWAYSPNPREKASFLKENFVPLKETRQLKYLDIEEGVEFLPNFNISFVYGHTEAMMLPYLKVNGKTIVYCADLIPSSHHIGLPYVMAYDLRPLNTLEEKRKLLELAVAEDYILFFEHDPVTECVTVKRNDRGRIVVDKTMTLKEALA